MTQRAPTAGRRARPLLDALEAGLQLVLPWLGPLALPNTPPPVTRPTTPPPAAPTPRPLAPTPPQASRKPASPSNDRAGVLEQALRQRIPSPAIRVTLTRNRRTILSFKGHRGEVLELRIHDSFVAAPPETLDAVAHFVANRAASARDNAAATRRTALRELQRWFSLAQADQSGPTDGSETPAPRQPTELVAAGQVHDLTAIRDEIVDRYFAAELANRPAVPVGWGRDRPDSACRRSRRHGGGHIRLGSYHHGDGVIRIHPRLDRAFVPRYVVAAVVHHELLHAVTEPRRGNSGRRILHDRAFRQRERQFVDYARAEAWVTANLGRLLR